MSAVWLAYSQIMDKHKAFTMIEKHKAVKNVFTVKGIQVSLGIAHGQKYAKGNAFIGREGLPVERMYLFQPGIVPVDL